MINFSKPIHIYHSPLLFLLSSSLLLLSSAPSTLIISPFLFLLPLNCSVSVELLSITSFSSSPLLLPLSSSSESDRSVLVRCDPLASFLFCWIVSNNSWCISLKFLYWTFLLNVFPSAVKEDAASNKFFIQPISFSIFFLSFIFLSAFITKSVINLLTFSNNSFFGMLLNRFAFVFKDSAAEIADTRPPSFMKSLFEMKNVGLILNALFQRVSLSSSAL